MTNYLQEFSFNIHKTGNHLPSDVITITPTPEGWILESDDGLEVWSEIYGTASAALMRAAALVRCYELDGTSFMSDAASFQDAAEEFLEYEVM